MSIFSSIAFLIWALVSPLPQPQPIDLGVLTLPAKSISLETRINAGQYDGHVNYITAKRFPITVSGDRALVLAHFQHQMTSEQVETWAEANGYEVATIEDLLAVGSSQHKDLQRELSIICLGSSSCVDGGRRVPYLSGDGGARYLGLGWYDDDWSDHCRFLLVRN